MTLSEWRKSQGKTLAEIAAQIGISGTNPARSLQRYESGERVMPALLQEAVQRVTSGQVTSADLFGVRLAWERRYSRLVLL